MPSDTTRLYSETQLHTLVIYKKKPAGVSSTALEENRVDRKKKLETNDGATMLNMKQLQTVKWVLS